MHETPMGSPGLVGKIFRGGFSPQGPQFKTHCPDLPIPCIRTQGSLLGVLLLGDS